MLLRTEKGEVTPNAAADRAAEFVKNDLLFIVDLGGGLKIENNGYPKNLNIPQLQLNQGTNG